MSPDAIVFDVSSAPINRMFEPSNLSFESSDRVTAVSSTMLVWLLTVATVTMPVMPVPVTTSPTATVPTFPSRVTLVDEDTAPFTRAVANGLSATKAWVTV